MVRQGVSQGSIPSTHKMVYSGGGMYLEVGINVRRAGNKMFFVNAPVWGGGRGVTYLHILALPYKIKCVLKEDRIVLTRG